MGVRRLIYALSLAVIYVAATMLSSLSIVLCDHEHHEHLEHGNSHQTEHCCIHCRTLAMSDVVLADDCCDHSHPMLGDHYTEIIVSEQRDSSHSYGIQLFTVTSIVPQDVLNTAPEPVTESKTYLYGDESEPLRAASADYKSLRAPPVLA